MCDVRGPPTICVESMQHTGLSPGHDTAVPVGERGLIQSMDQDIVTHADGIIATLALISALYVAILAWCKQSTDT